MRNLKAYSKLLLGDINFKVRPLKISLSRSFFFNYDGDDGIYYRKSRSVPRKMESRGRIYHFQLDNTNIPSNSLEINDTTDQFDEYFSREIVNRPKITKVKDIVEKKKKMVKLSDSMVKKYYKDEIINMNFEPVLNINMVNNQKNVDGRFIDKVN